MNPKEAASITLTAVVVSASLAGHHEPAIVPDDLGAEWAYSLPAAGPAIYANGSNSLYRSARDRLTVSDSAEVTILRFGS